MPDDLASRIIRDMERRVITEGSLAGQPFRVLPWQIDMVEGFVGNRRTALSMARANGKTSFLAALACAALDPDGPLHINRGEIIVHASSLDQANVLFRHVKFFMEDITNTGKDGALDRKKWRVADNHHYKNIEYLPTGTSFRAMGSDSKRAHGRAPSLIILDEPAKWVSGGEALYVAARTSMGKQPNAKMACIGTRPEDETHWFAQLLDSPDKFTWTRSYHADKDDDDFAMETIRKANPSIDHMPAIMEEIESAIESAKKVGGTALSSYRALHLNLGTAETAAREMLVDLDIWKGLVLTGDPNPREGPVAIGIDLGGGISMSAIAFYWPTSGRLETYGAFPAKPTLAERGRSDGVGSRYEKMLAAGEVQLYGAYETDNAAFLRDRLALVADHEWLGDPIADNFAKTSIAQAMLQLGRNPEAVNHRRVGRGEHGKEDVEAFQSEVLSGHMSVGHNIILDSAISQSRIIRDTNGNPALRKDATKGRIDVLQAAILAVGEGERWRNPPSTPLTWDIDAMVA